MFYRITEEGNAQIFHTSGEMVARIYGEPRIYPIGSPLSCEYEHPKGIILTIEDAEKIGIFSE